ncbi:transmembrane protein 242 isoform X2 [Rhodnius prolixus]|uniref:transmembrane protein 242 isoform X2 n=1 Tax=Rhodnius prolixus TaxID=13249 RepID=UPI003D1899C1
MDVTSEKTPSDVADNFSPSSNVKDINYRLKASAKRKDPKMFQIGSSFSREYQENGVELAMRALKWGTFYAVTGCSLVCYGIWKFSGAKSMEEFRFRMGSILPKIPKNEIPQSRTEFAGLTDLLTYLANDYGKAKTDSKEN